MIYYRPLPEYGDLMTVEEFKKAVSLGAFTDDDGIGRPVKDNLMDPKLVIYPSRLGEIPADATHVIWFNK